MPQFTTNVGPITGQDGSSPPIRQGRTGEMNVGDAHGRYNEAVARGNVFSLSVAAAGPTAYVGAAGGTPLLAFYNPAGSGKNCSLLMVNVAVAVTAGTAGLGDFELWAGPSVLPTGTLVSPVNQLSLAASGSIAKGVSNTAITSSTALTNNFPVAVYYWATAASAFMAPGVFDIAGALVAAPGNMIALGLSVLPASTTVSCSLIWEEIPQ